MLGRPGLLDGLAVGRCCQRRQAQALRQAADLRAEGPLGSAGRLACAWVLEGGLHRVPLAAGWAVDARPDGL